MPKRIVINDELLELGTVGDDNVTTIKIPIADKLVSSVGSGGTFSASAKVPGVEHKIEAFRDGENVCFTVPGELTIIPIVYFVQIVYTNGSRHATSDFYRARVMPRRERRNNNA